MKARLLKQNISWFVYQKDKTINSACIREGHTEYSQHVN